MRPNKNSKWLIGGESSQGCPLVEKTASRKRSMMLIDGENNFELV